MSLYCLGHTVTVLVDVSLLVTTVGLSSVVSVRRQDFYSLGQVEYVPDVVPV